MQLVLRCFLVHHGSCGFHCTRKTIIYANVSMVYSLLLTHRQYTADKISVSLEKLSVGDGIFPL